MGFFGSIMGGGSYEPGGAHHVKITDQAFERAVGELSNADSPYAGPFRAYAAEQVTQFEIGKYEAHDLPVTQILGSFFLAHYFQEEVNGTPESSRLGYLEIGRKDTLDYQKWVETWKNKLPNNERGLVGIMSKGFDKDSSGASFAAGAAALAAKGIQLGVARLVTGKSKDVRLLETHYVNYICGDSRKAKEYLLGFADKFGALDEAVLSTLQVMQANFWIHEIARANRAKQ